MPMARLARALPTPIILITSLPLISLAAFTTTLAFSTLLIRVAVVYCELFLALLQSAINGPDTLGTAAKSSNALAERQEPTKMDTRERRRRSSSIVHKSASSGSLASKPLISPLTAKSVPASLPTSATLPATRDYEGVGGWHLGMGDDPMSPPLDSAWLGSSNFLELPILNSPSPPARSSRAATQPMTACGSNGSPVTNHIGRSPGYSRYSGSSRRTSGTSSPEGYFTSRTNLHGMNTSAKIARSDLGDVNNSRRSSVSMVKLIAID